MRHLIGHAVNSGRRELDFTVGDESFKRRFTNATRTTACLRVFRRPSGYLFEQMRRTTVQAMKRGAATISGGRSER
jgi:hypothetical protein